MPKQSKKPKKQAKGNARIKEVSGTHWVLHQQNDVKKYKGFKSKTEAESFAASTPIEKGVKITATKAKRETVKKKNENTADREKPETEPPCAERQKRESGIV